MEQEIRAQKEERSSEFPAVIYGGFQQGFQNRYMKKENWIPRNTLPEIILLDFCKEVNGIMFKCGKIMGWYMEIVFIFKSNFPLWLCILFYSFYKKFICVFPNIVLTYIYQVFFDNLCQGIPILNLHM